MTYKQVSWTLRATVHPDDINEKALAVRKTLAANLLKARQAKGLTQEQLSLASGLNRTYVLKAEKATINITVETLVKLSVALEVPPHKLLAP